MTTATLSIRLVFNDETYDVALPLDEHLVRKLQGPFGFRRDEALDHLNRMGFTQIDILLRERDKQRKASTT